MKIYLFLIRSCQNMLLWVSIAMLLVLPSVLALKPDLVSETLISRLYDTSHIALFLVMTVRPLADFLPTFTWIRLLVVLRKGLGVFSASIIVSFILAKIIIDPGGYFMSIATLPYWSMRHFAALAHLGDITAIILLVTSNIYSRRILGSAWKEIQRLAYVYFYASSLYVVLTFGSIPITISLIVVTILTLAAFQKNRQRRLAQVTSLQGMTVNAGI